MKILPDWMVDVSEWFDDCIIVLHKPCEDHFSLYYLCFSILFRIFVPIIYIWLTFEAETKAFGEYEKFRRIQDKTLLSDFDKFIEGL